MYIYIYIYVRTHRSHTSSVRAAASVTTFVRSSDCENRIGSRQRVLTHPANGLNPGPVVGPVVSVFKP